MFKWNFMTKDAWWFDVAESTSEKSTVVYSTGQFHTSNNDEGGRKGGRERERERNKAALYFDDISQSHFDLLYFGQNH